MSEFAFAGERASPRKRPRQERSTDTVAAILEATVRVLHEVDGERLTTTRVAEVAGVSVGTLYQYFPNRDALLNALLADHLEIAISALEAAALAHAGRPRAEAAPALVRAFLAAKAARVETSRLLNKAFGVGRLDERPLVAAAGRRAHRAVAAAMAEGGEPDAETLARAGVACAAIEGMVRAAVAEDPARMRDPAWIEQVVAAALAVISA